MEPEIDVVMLDGMTEHDRFFVSSMRGDLMRWLTEEGQPAEGVEVLAVVPLMSTGDAPEYGVVLWRDAAGKVHVWTAWQYRDTWDASATLRVIEARAETYERYAKWSRAFVALALRERALAILDRAPDVPPDPGDELPES